LPPDAGWAPPPPPAAGSPAIVVIKAAQVAGAAVEVGEETIASRFTLLSWFPKDFVFLLPLFPLINFSFIILLLSLG
jgi:hypothetical protein